MNLDQLPIGQSATVTTINGSRSFARRLLSLGLCPGTSLHVVRVAPLGDPLQVQIGRSSLAIRRSEAALVQVHS
jgi:ferrous iron transport protein A